MLPADGAIFWPTGQLPVELVNELVFSSRLLRVGKQEFFGLSVSNISYSIKGVKEGKLKTLSNNFFSSKFRCPASRCGHFLKERLNIFFFFFLSTHLENIIALNPDVGRTRVQTPTKAENLEPVKLVAQFFFVIFLFLRRRFV